jgi:hypothetical protein
MALLWPAMAAATAGMAEARGLPGISEGVASLHRQSGLIVPAAQLDFTARDVQLEPGVEVPLSLRLPSADQLKRASSETGSFILVRNIPEGLSLSEGMPIGTNWIMSLPQGGRARIVARPGTTGNHRLEFLLIGPGNRVLAEASVVARLAEPKAKTAADDKAFAEKPVAALSGGTEPEKPRAAPAPVVAPPKPSVSREEEAILLAKGAELIGQGGIAAARLMFEELAQQGSSQGALAMARTYDPAYIAAAPAGSLVTDIPKARKWYERAAELGSREATVRLSKLNPR